ncbi:uncharacterized protein LOC113518547 isoform X1 [Galleria mellonella]|uniref:Uncharacterized protein LOC113518547 isoform X1 n=1 Tax=Galleria mellonella TaxID=7137 RepID=A0A6J3C6K0_GALME|nr:uncharacterized protein LOC113518547 isoform X1 [Galleria mellonella]
MDYCYPEDCSEFAVTPMLTAPCYQTKSEELPLCYACMPECPKGRFVYCSEKRLPKTPPRTPNRYSKKQKDCDDLNSRSYHGHDSSYRRRNLSPCAPQSYCPTCCQSTCKPIKTKYVIPCYRYEDGRIERYVPTRYGRLPMSAYRRNGMQDQIHGYRGAIRYLCTGSGHDVPCVYTAVEPLCRVYPKITQEMYPVKKKNKK